MTRITYFDTFEGANPYAFLSNFYVGEPIVLLAQSYATGEHAFQALKATSWVAHDLVQGAKNPAAAKMRGKRQALRHDWETVKYDVMRAVLIAKFGQGSVLAEALLSTGHAMLIEGNTWGDKVWGATQRTTGSRLMGRNWLGGLLMLRRAELLSDEPDADTMSVELNRFIRPAWMKG